MTPASCDHLRAAPLNPGAATVEAGFRREYGRGVAALIRFLGGIDAAEEAVQDAFTVAAARWPSDGRAAQSAILTLYDQPYAFTPTPVVALNRAIALAEVPGLAAVDELSTPAGGLDGYYLFHAARADLLRRIGRDEEAAAAYDAARALTANPVEQAFLDARRTAVSGPRG